MKMRKTEALKLLNLKVVGETGEATTIAELIKFLAENYHGGGGGGAVDSVNGKTGKVELISKDIPVGGEDKRTLDQAVADSIEKINDKTGKEIVIRAEDIPYEEEGLSVHDEIFGKQNKPYIAEAKEKQTIDGVEVPTIDYLQARQIVTRFGEGTDCRISYTAKPYPFSYQVADAEVEDGSIFVVKVNTGNGTIVYMANGERVNVRIDNSIESVKELINETNVKTFEVELDATTFLPVIDEKNLDEWLDYAKRGRMEVFHGIDQYQYDRTYTVQTAVNDTIMITAIATDGVAYYIANVTDREWKELGKQ